MLKTRVYLIFQLNLMRVIPFNNMLQLLWSKIQQKCLFSTSAVGILSSDINKWNNIHYYPSLELIKSLIAGFCTN